MFLVYDCHVACSLGAVSGRRYLELYVLCNGNKEAQRSPQADVNPALCKAKSSLCHTWELSQSTGLQAYVITPKA